MKKLVNNNLILDLLNIYEFKIQAYDDKTLKCYDMQTNEVITFDKERLINYFLEDYIHKLSQSDVTEEQDYYKEVITGLKGL